MSQHHMLLPIIYTPPPKPKKVEPKKRRATVGMLDDMDEAAETSETSVTGQAAPVGLTLPLTHMPDIEGPASKPQGPAGRLSHDTLTALLRAQELKN